MSENADQTVMRRKPMLPRMAPSASPASSSRRITRHQSREPDLAERQRADDERRRLRPRVAAAGDDQRHEQRQHDRLRDLRLEGAHRRGGQHLAQEQRRQPAGALLNHPPKRDVHVGLVERLGAADALDVRVAVASATSSTSSIVTMPMSMPAVSVTGSAVRSYWRNTRDRRLLIVGGLQRDEAPIHQIGDLAVERGQQELANADVVDQQPLSSTT